MEETSVFEKINDNNLRAFVIHGAVILLWVLLLLPFDLFSLSPTDFILYPYALLVVPLLYVALGYRFLVPIPEKNLLSVSYLTILFVVLSIILSVSVLAGGLSDLIGAGYGTFTFAVVAPNIPSIYALIMGYELIAGASPTHHLIPLIISYCAAFLPSLLMLAGLRIKVWRQSKAVPAAPPSPPSQPLM